MSTSRINQLLKFYEEEPKDPFNIYALALEYLNHDVNQAKSLFDKLLTEHSSYIPTYYHAAKLYQQLDDIGMASKIYETGIEKARQANDTKAFRELKSSYDEMMF